LNLKPVCPEQRSHICHRHPAGNEALLSLLLAEQLLQALVSAPSHAGCEWDDGIWFRGGQYETLDDTPDGRNGQALSMTGVRWSRETRSLAKESV
jgi:hypothetical protein